MRSLLLICTLLIGSLAQAGNDWFETGNGGFVIQCEGKKTELLDLYEAQTSLQLVLDQSAESLTSLDVRMEHLFNKLEKQDTYRAKLFRGWYKDFFKSANFLTGYTINPLPDVGFTFIPKGCKLDLAVYQVEPTRFLKDRYTINKDLWNELDTLNQAALVMHELIYREARSFGTYHKTSQSTRVLNAWLNSIDFDKATPRDYLEALQELKFHQASFKGHTILLNKFDRLRGTWLNISLAFHNAETLKTAEIVELNTESKKLTQRAPYCISFPEIDKLVAKSAIFDSRGNLTRLTIAMPEDLFCENFYSEEKFYLNATHFTFDQNGFVRVTGKVQFGNTLIFRNQRIYFGKETPEVSYTTNTNNQLESMEFPQNICWHSGFDEIRLIPGTIPTQYTVDTINKHRLPVCK